MILGKTRKQKELEKKIKNARISEWHKHFVIVCQLVDYRWAFFQIVERSAHIDYGGNFAGWYYKEVESESTS